MEPTPSEGTPAAAPAGRALPPERRLHPLSFLFVFLSQSKGVLAALAALVLFRRGGWSEIIAALSGAGVLALFAHIRARAFRYRLTGDELIVREGVFARTERHVPYARVQNIVQRRNPLHRTFGVTELRLESAGGARPEAVMSVITVAAAQEIEAVLRRGAAGGTAASDEDAAGPAFAPARVLAVPSGDLLRLGLVTSRGWFAVGAVFAVLASTPFAGSSELRAAARWVRQRFQAWTDPRPALAVLEVETVLAWLTGAALFLIVVKLLSVVMAFLAFHRFRLWRRGERLRTEAGLFTRNVASARLDKIQRLLVGETWLSRRVGLRWLSCAVAAGGSEPDDGGGRLSWLLPAGKPAQVEAVLGALDLRLDLETLPWTALHPHAWRRKLVALATVATAGSLPVLWFLGPLVGPGFWLLMLAVAVVRARGWARFARYAWAGELIAVRSGWWRRCWTITWVAKGQVVLLAQSPLDRHHGMATVVLDTAGTSNESFHLRIPYLPEREARALALALQRGAAAAPDPPALAAGGG